MQIPAWFFVSCSARSEDGKQDAIAHAKDSLLTAVASGQPAGLKLEAGHVMAHQAPAYCKRVQACSKFHCNGVYLLPMTA